MKRLQIPQKLAYEKFYVHEIYHDYHDWTDQPTLCWKVEDVIFYVF